MTKGDRVLLLNIDYSVVADTTSPIAMAVDDANYPAIIRAFNVAAYSPSGDPVIDVTSLFMTDVPEFSVRGRIGGRGYDATRSFLEKAVSFPENINVEVTQTFTGGADPAAGGGGRGREGAARGMRGSSGTVLTHHSMVKLPEKPMMPRLFDERVGYFTQGLTDYGTDEHRSVAKRYIARYRLEKKDPNAEVSEPVKPIVYYVDPATPKKWVPFVIKGIEDWQVAFEAAGFKNAIIAKEAPAERSRLERRGRAVFRDSLAAVDDGERVGSAHPRPADRRDSRSGHPVLPQRPEPREELVLHPGRSARSAREDSCRCPTI